MQTLPLTLKKLIAEYKRDSIVYQDRGWGSNEQLGRQIAYTEGAARDYGKLHMQRLLKPIVSEDGIECRYASEWQDTKKDGVYEGANGYQFRILF